MTKVYCTDHECIHNNHSICQNPKIVLELDAGRRGSESWICWSCKLPRGSYRKAPDELPDDGKKPDVRKVKGVVKKKKRK